MSTNEIADLQDASKEAAMKNQYENVYYPAITAFEDKVADVDSLLYSNTFMNIPNEIVGLISLVDELEKISRNFVKH